MRLLTLFLGSLLAAGVLALTTHEGHRMQASRLRQADLAASGTSQFHAAAPTGHHHAHHQPEHVVIPSAELNMGPRVSATKLHILLTCSAWIGFLPLSKLARVCMRWHRLISQTGLYLGAVHNSKRHYAQIGSLTTAALGALFQVGQSENTGFHATVGWLATGLLFLLLGFDLCRSLARGTA